MPVLELEAAFGDLVSHHPMNSAEYAWGVAYSEERENHAVIRRTYHPTKEVALQRAADIIIEGGTVYRSDGTEVSG